MAETLIKDEYLLVAFVCDCVDVKVPYHKLPSAGEGKSNTYKCCSLLPQTFLTSFSFLPPETFHLCLSVRGKLLNIDCWRDWGAWRERERKRETASLQPT